MNELRAIYAIWLRDMKRLWLDRARLLIGLVQPALYLFVLGGGLGSVARFGPNASSGNYIQFVFPGVIGLAVLSTAVFSAISVVFDREFGFLKGVLVAPVSRRAIVLGKSFAGASQSLVQGSLILVFAPFVGAKFGILTIFALLGIMLLIGFAMTALSVLAASRMKSTEAFPIIINGLLLPLFFLSGALYPSTNLPAWLAPLVTVNPLTYGVDALRAAALPNGLEVAPGQFIAASTHSLGLSLAVIVVFGFVAATLAIWSFSKGE